MKKNLCWVKWSQKLHWTTICYALWFGWKVQTTHTGFVRLSRLSGRVVHVLVNWAFMVAKWKQIMRYPSLGMQALCHFKHNNHTVNVQQQIYMKVSLVPSGDSGWSKMDQCSRSRAHLPIPLYSPCTNAGKTGFSRIYRFRGDINCGLDVICLHHHCNGYVGRNRIGWSIIPKCVDIIGPGLPGEWDFMVAKSKTHTWS